MRMGAHLELAALVASCVPCSAANRAIDMCISHRRVLSRLSGGGARLGIALAESI